MILTSTGRIIDYDDIKIESIDFGDIILSLPRLNRFVGHSTRAYSVAEHSVWCYVMAEKLGYSPRLKLLTLIHDFTEAYVGDCPSPLKRLLPDYSLIEARVENAILQKLKIEPPTPEEHLLVKKIDMTMLIIEMRDLTLHDYKFFIEADVYPEFLDDKDFDLKNFNIIDEAFVRNTLTDIFDSVLMEQED